MVGAPGSGKSTYVKNKLSEYHLISCDEIREKTFGYERTIEIRIVVYKKILALVNDLVSKKVSFVIDTTYFNELKYREELSKIILAERIHVIYFDKPIDVCLLQNTKRTPSRVIPDEMIKYLFNQIDSPQICEGFQSVSIIK